ncbi:unnamed protein product [Blepharisma stoltei]|uniref:Uncharacterized protein n=1 Tax=Blepharisma stoltei TaxID=1481888 RepID=A0AAU9JFD3_9CILI|nr:unnamed protein product [Blepharisma stoltei]
MRDEKPLLPSPSKTQIGLVYFLIFTIEFEYALEYVFINPFFNRHNCSVIFLSTIWLFPSILTLISQPIWHKYVYSDYSTINSKKKLLIYLLCSTTILGIITLISSSSIAELCFRASIDASEKARNASIILGFIGFMLISASHNILLEISLGFSEDEIDSSYTVCGCFGRMAGFFIASIDCFEIYSFYMHYNVGDNITFSFLAVSLLYVLTMCIAVPYISFRAKIDSASISYPSASSLVSLPWKMKLLMLTYFLTLGSNLLISIYATSWVSMAIWDENYIKEDQRRYNMGLSWGAFTLLISCLVTIVVIYVIPLIRKYQILRDSYILGLTHLICAIALITTHEVGNFQSIFIIIPICGFSFGANIVLPQHLFSEMQSNYFKQCDKLPYLHRRSECSEPKELSASKSRLFDTISNNDIHQIGKNDWKVLLNMTSLISQIVMFGFIPALIALFIGGDYIKWGMTTAGISALAGSVLSFAL